MVCSQCHTPNFRDYKYCRECGTRLEAGEALAPVDDHAEVEQLLQHAFVQMEQGELDKALGTVQAALARDPENPAAHSVLGLVYEREGRIQEAIHQFRVVLQLSPDSTADREKLQQLLARGGGWDGERRTVSPLKLAVASAVAAGVVTFGVGLFLATNRPASAGGPSQAANPTPAALQPVNRPGTMAPITNAPTVPQTAPTPIQPTARPTPAYVPPLSSGPMALVPSQPRQETRPTPPAPWQAQTQARSNGLQPAQIGEVVPLTRPDFTPTPNPSPERVSLESKQAPEPRAQSKPRVEPLEPETGFIKIEPIEKPVSPQVAGTGAPAPAGTPTPTAESSKPSISITITPGAR